MHADTLAEVYPVQCTTQKNKTRKGEKVRNKGNRRSCKKDNSTSTTGVLTERGGINEMRALLCRAHLDESERN